MTQVYKVALGNRPVSCDLVSYKAALNWARQFDNGELPDHLIIFCTERSKRNNLFDVDCNGNETVVEHAIYL